MGKKRRKSPSLSWSPRGTPFPPLSAPPLPSRLHPTSGHRGGGGGGGTRYNFLVLHVAFGYGSTCAKSGANLSSVWESLYCV